MFTCGDSGNRDRELTGAEREKRDKDNGIGLEHDKRFASIFTYNTSAQFAANKYGAFDDIPPPRRSRVDDRLIVDIIDEAEEEQQHSIGNELGTETATTAAGRLVELTCTALASSLFLLTLPFSLFFSLKFVGPTERLVVMRLGRTRGVYGQGTVLLLPIVDKAMAVDLKLTSITLPDVHVMSADRGLAQLGAVLFVKVCDPLVACCALQNREQMLQSLAYTALTRQLTKRLLNDITNPASLSKTLLKIQDELNDFVRPHGVKVERLTVSQVQVLKPADNAAVSVFHTLLKSELGQQLMGQVGGHLKAAAQATGNKGWGAGPEEEAMAMAAAAEAMKRREEETVKTTQNEEGKREELRTATACAAVAVDPELDALLARIRGILAEGLVQRVGKHFRVLCPELGAQAEFDIDLRPATGGPRGWCGWTGQRPAMAASATAPPPPDVHFTLAKPTLLQLIQGGLSPMSAYLDGLVQIRGRVQDAAALKHVADAMQQQQQQLIMLTNNSNNQSTFAEPTQQPPLW